MKTYYFLGCETVQSRRSYVFAAYLTYVATLKMEVYVPLEPRSTSNGLHWAHTKR
jgi:hypothetical protein